MDSNISQKTTMPVLGDPAAGEAPQRSLPGGVAAALLAELPAAVLVVFAGGSCWANRRARAILGRELELAELASIFGLVPGERTEIPRSSEQDYRRGDGDLLTLGYRVEPLTGGAGGHIVLFQNISDVVSLRKERDRYLKLASLTASVGTLAHEIKNPLAAIRCLLEVLEEETTRPKHLRDLETAVAETARLAALVDGFASLAGAGGGEPFDAAAAVREAAAAAARTAGRRGIELATRVPEKLTLATPGLSADLLALVTRHLLTNALEACGGGARIEIALEHAGRDLRLAVTDEGAGIDHEVLAQAPEPFFSTKPGCSGIGLALVQEVARRCGGELVLESEPSRGTRVELIWPPGGPSPVEAEKAGAHMPPGADSEQSAAPVRR